MFEIESPLQIVYARLNRAVLLANFLATVHHDNEANGNVLGHELSCAIPMPNLWRGHQHP